MRKDRTMRIFGIILLVMVGIVFGSPSQAVFPWFPVMEWQSDSIQAVDSLVGWPLGSGAYSLTVINPDTTYLRIQFDTEDTTLVATWFDSTEVRVDYTPPFVLASPWDSVFIEAEDTCNVYLEWWGK